MQAEARRGSSLSWAHAWLEPHHTLVNICASAARLNHITDCIIATETCSTQRACDCLQLHTPLPLAREGDVQSRQAAHVDTVGRLALRGALAVVHLHLMYLYSLRLLLHVSMDLTSLQGSQRVLGIALVVFQVELNQISRVAVPMSGLSNTLSPISHVTSHAKFAWLCRRVRLEPFHASRLQKKQSPTNDQLAGVLIGPPPTRNVQTAASEWLQPQLFSHLA